MPKVLNFIALTVFLGLRKDNLHLNKFFMGILKQVGEYLYLKKKDPNAPNSQFVKYMHGINRLSIFLFLVALVIIVVKLILR